ncbi:MAG: DNA polymerase III subunit alpha [Anderseniella sp.]
MTDSSAASFIHLRTHSAYSLSEGALKIKTLSKLATAQAMPALAITDTGNLFGALEFAEVMTGAGIQPIIGCTLLVDSEDGPEGPAHNRNALDLARLVLLAKDEAGYRNLLKLSSRAYLDAPETELPHVGLAAIEELSGGLICLTGGPGGLINKPLLENRHSVAKTRIERLKQVFGDRLYVELQRHGMDEERAAEPGLVDLAYALELPLVASNEPYFAEADDFAAHDALICIAEGEVVANENRRQLTPEHYFKSQSEMVTLFADLPEAIDNTVEIARRCSWYPCSIDPILPKFASGEDSRDEAEELRVQSREGLAERLDALGLAAGFSREDYQQRLEYELGVITGMDFPGYFLIVADFIKWAKSQGIPVGPGRGSGAGSVVAWALTITDLDPLRFNLVFERFLNPERVSMPDFDIDFCQDRRDEVIAYVQNKYGAGQVAQIITFGKLQARAVCRDVGRVLQMPYGQVDRLCKLIPNNPANPVTLQQAIDVEPRLEEERRQDETTATMLEIALKLEGLYRHASTHAAGVVIGDRPLEELVPLYRDPRSPMPVTQFNMKLVEKAGLVKFDFLGLKTLTVLDKGVKLLAQRGIEMDFAALPLDDTATYDMLKRAETVGVFQLESSGMRDLIRKAEPGNIEDIIALVALYRPGPMENIPKYVASKKGEEAPEFLHEKLTHVVEDTYGIIIYQEQVLQIAQVLAGYSLGEADLLRRAMGKKIQAEMDAQKARFVSGSVDNGVDQGQAEQIFELVNKFAGYGFNKAHSAAYGVVAYQTAWLKANHPVEFLAASMSLDSGNTDKLLVFKREADRMKVVINPPSINKSGVDFTVEDGAIQYSLAALKNVGEQAVEHVIAVREEGGPFKSLGDFARRIDPRMMNKRALESISRSGGFDELNPNRAQVVKGVETILAMANRTSAEAEIGQDDFFGGGGDHGAEELPLQAVEPWLPMDQLAEEFEAVGFYLSGHPLDEYLSILPKLGADSWEGFRAKALKGASAARLTGTVTYKQERRAKSGNKFAFIGFSDPTGQYECVCFSETLNACRDLLEAGKPLMVRVEADVEGEDVKLRLQGVDLLDERADRVEQGLEIFLDDTKPLALVQSRLTNGGNSSVVLNLRLPDELEVRFRLGEKFTVNPKIKAAIKAVPGVVDVQDL